MVRKPAFIGLIGLICFFAAGWVQADPKPIYTVTIADTIGPGVAE